MLFFLHYGAGVTHSHAGLITHAPGNQALFWKLHPLGISTKRLTPSENGQNMQFQNDSDWTQIMPNFCLVYLSPEYETCTEKLPGALQTSFKTKLQWFFFHCMLYSLKGHGTPNVSYVFPREGITWHEMPTPIQFNDQELDIEWLYPGGKGYEEQKYSKKSALLFSTTYLVLVPPQEVSVNPVWSQYILPKITKKYKLLILINKNLRIFISSCI